MWTQKHDFGYELAEKLGKHDPSLEAHYKALADAMAVGPDLTSRTAMVFPLLATPVGEPGSWFAEGRNSSAID